MHHKSKVFERMIKQIKNTVGFSVENSANKYVVKHSNGSMYIAHYGEKAIHPLRRFYNANKDS